jgi:hypothetical protein
MVLVTLDVGHAVRRFSSSIPRIFPSGSTWSLTAWDARHRVEDGVRSFDLTSTGSGERVEPVKPPCVVYDGA